jgi:hypothetical protein
MIVFHIFHTFKIFVIQNFKKVLLCCVMPGLCNALDQFLTMWYKIFRFYFIVLKYFSFFSHPQWRNLLAHGVMQWINSSRCDTIPVMFKISGRNARLLVTNQIVQWWQCMQCMPLIIVHQKWFLPLFALDPCLTDKCSFAPLQILIVFTGNLLLWNIDWK